MTEVAAEASATASQEASQEALADLVLAALRPSGLRERARALLAPGFTAAQVLDRLPRTRAEALRASHAFPAEPVHAALLAQVRAGTVRTRKVRYTVVLNTKGHRDMVVDVFWPA